MIRKLEIPKELTQDDEVRVLMWHKRDGDAIAPGDALVELETNKAVVLVTSEQRGFLRRRFANEGDWMKLGEVAAFISDSADEPVPDAREASAEGMMAKFETT